MAKFLVSNPNATKFLDLASTNAGRKAYLGDASKYPVVAQGYITAAIKALGDGVAKVAALAADETRNDVQRHAAARTIANNVVTSLESARTNLAIIGERLLQEATDEINTTFQPSISRAAFDAENMRWIREQIQHPEGILKIKQAAMDDVNIANVIFNASPFALGMAVELHSSLKFQLTERHAPEAYKNAEQAVEVTVLAGKYEKAIAKVQGAFYEPAKADKAATRVDV